MYYVSVFGGLNHHGGVDMVAEVTPNCGNGFFSDIWWVRKQREIGGIYITYSFPQPVLQSWVFVCVCVCLQNQLYFFNSTFMASFLINFCYIIEYILHTY